MIMKSFKIDNFNEENYMKEEVQDTNIFKNQQNKINNDINNNLIKKKEESNKKIY